VRILRILLIAAAIAITLAIAAPLILLAVGIQVDVSKFGPKVSEIASDTLGRQVTLDGPIYIVPSYWPTLEIHGLRIADPFGAEDAEFMRLGRARVVLDLLPLLRRRVALDEIMADTRAGPSTDWPKKPRSLRPSRTTPRGRALDASSPSPS
jgi:uncharacterized protein involved in outer membrane biogenesis